MQQNASDSSGSSNPVYLDVAARLAEVFLWLESDVLQCSLPQLRLRNLGTCTFRTNAGLHKDPLPLAPPKLFSTQPDPVIPAHSPVSDRWLVGKAPHCRPLPRSRVRISNTIGPPKAEALTRLPLSFGSSGDGRPSASESDGVLSGYWYGAPLR